MSSQCVRYFVHLSVNNLFLDVLPPYEVFKTEYEYLTGYIYHRMTEQDRKHLLSAFIWFETVDGLNILASEDDIDMICFFTELSSTLPSPPPIQREPEGRDDEIVTTMRMNGMTKPAQEDGWKYILEDAQNPRRREIGVYPPLMDSLDWDDLTEEEEFMYRI